MNDLVPSEPDFEGKILSYTSEMDEMLSDLAKGCLKINRVPRNAERKQRFFQAMQEAFELVGGVPRLAIWADHNYTEFAKIMGKQMPGMIQNALQINTNGGQVIIQSSLAPPAMGGDALEGEFTVKDNG